MSSAPQPSDYHDALTELPNRRLFDDRLKQALHLASRRDSGIALVLRKADTLARWGAAEFAVILTDVTDEAPCRIAAAALVRNADAARARARELGRRHYRLYAR